MKSQWAVRTLEGWCEVRGGRRKRGGAPAQSWKCASQVFSICLLRLPYAQDKERLQRGMRPRSCLPGVSSLHTQMVTAQARWSGYIGGRRSPDERGTDHLGNPGGPHRGGDVELGP